MMWIYVDIFGFLGPVWIYVWSFYEWHLSQRVCQEDTIMEVVHCNQQGCAGTQGSMAAWVIHQEARIQNHVV